MQPVFLIGLVFFFLNDNLDKSRQAFSPTCSLNSSQFATENFQQPPQWSSTAKTKQKMMLQTLGGEWWGNNFFFYYRAGIYNLKILFLCIQVKKNHSP